jgi:hypothetical protein
MADVIFVKTANKRNMILNAEPDVNGNCAIIRREGYEPLVHVYENAQRARDSLGKDIELYTSHFATCPEAHKWRYR